MKQARIIRIVGQIQPNICGRVIENLIFPESFRQRSRGGHFGNTVLKYRFIQIQR